MYTLKETEGGFMKDMEFESFWEAIRWLEETFGFDIHMVQSMTNIKTMKDEGSKFITVICQGGFMHFTFTKTI